MKPSLRPFFLALLIVAFSAQTAFSAERPLAEAIKNVLDQQGKAELPQDCVVDVSVVEEFLRERR